MMSLFSHARSRRLPGRTRAVAACTALAVTGLLTLTVTVPARAAGTKPFLYVANGIGNNVTVYDLTANATTATIPAGTSRRAWRPRRTARPYTSRTPSAASR